MTTETHDAHRRPLSPDTEPSETPDRPARRRSRALPLTAALTLATALTALTAAGTGAYDIPLTGILNSIAHKTGMGGAELDRVAESVLWNARFPRVTLALLIGASLGCAGALMQGVFGNPLAEPGVIGISAGAAVGAVGTIALGWRFLGQWTVTACAFAAGLVTVLAVYALSRACGRTEVVTLILTGIAVNAFAGALLTAAAVAVAGIITFVGLLIPHLLRMAAGPGHRFLVPGSALGGAPVLVSADLAARTAAEPAELPLGVLTALFGSPFFFWLLRRTRRKQGGWA